MAYGTISEISWKAVYKPAKISRMSLLPLEKSSFDVFQSFKWQFLGLVERYLKFVFSSEISVLRPFRKGATCHFWRFFFEPWFLGKKEEEIVAFILGVWQGHIASVDDEKRKCAHWLNFLNLCFFRLLVWSFCWLKMKVPRTTEKRSRWLTRVKQRPLFGGSFPVFLVPDSSPFKDRWVYLVRRTELSFL